MKEHASGMNLMVARVPFHQSGLKQPDMIATCSEGRRQHVTIGYLDRQQLFVTLNSLNSTLPNPKHPNPTLNPKTLNP